MSEKPQKRLVGWKEYLGTTGKKGASYSLAYALLGSGLTLLFLSALLFLTSLSYWLFTDTWFVYKGEGQRWSMALVSLGGVAAAVGSVTVWGAYTLSVKARKIARVELITRHNTGNLPATETLVRPSDLPPSHQPSVLLRAAPPGRETPAEELLRATKNSKDD
ncbi:MAG: hypothetical protein JWL77_2947 [Chthonomonadaceae bacterium]|nr:hypothetical protein [Chthonomonadaceae bacterium]